MARHYFAISALVVGLRGNRRAAQAALLILCNGGLDNVNPREVTLVFHS